MQPVLCSHFLIKYFRQGQIAPKTILFQAEFAKFVHEQKYDSTILFATLFCEGGGKCMQICALAIKGLKTLLLQT